MKANELKIGNYVNADGNHKKVYNLYSNGWDFLHDDIDCRFVEYQNTKPIPLTEVWLLKFGFDMSKHYKYFTKFAGNNVMSVYCFEDFTRIEIVTQSICTIKYVHQLQNLYFALTNEELTIKL